MIMSPPAVPPCLGMSSFGIGHKSLLLIRKECGAKARHPDIDGTRHGGACPH